MIISDWSIKRKIELGDIQVEPYLKDNVQPASLDLTLGNSFAKLKTGNNACISMDSQNEYEEFRTDVFILPPKSFVLARTNEYIRLPDYIAAEVAGRSSIGRLGLFIQNAGHVDPGFEGTITLELYNAGELPIKLESGRRICQLIFHKLDYEAQSPYSGKYNGQIKATGSRIDMDKEACNTWNDLSEWAKKFSKELLYGKTESGNED